MGTPQQEDVIGVLQLQGKQKEQGLDTLAASVHIVSQEKIVCELDVSIWHVVRRRAESLEESIELVDLPMNVPKYFGRSPNPQKSRLFIDYPLDALQKPINVLAGNRVSDMGSGPTEQVVQKEAIDLLLSLLG